MCQTKPAPSKPFLRERGDKGGVKEAFLAQQVRHGCWVVGGLVFKIIISSL